MYEILNNILKTYWVRKGRISRKKVNTYFSWHMLAQFELPELLERFGIDTNNRESYRLNKKRL